MILELFSSLGGSTILTLWTLDGWSQLPICRPKDTRCCQPNGKLLATGATACLLWQRDFCSVKSQSLKKKKNMPLPKFATQVLFLLWYITSKLMFEHTGWKGYAGQMDIKHSWILPTSRNICDLQVGNLRWVLVWCPPWHRGGSSLWGALPNSLSFSTVCSVMRNVSPGYCPERSLSSLQLTRTSSDCSDCF